jgi:hypothetical protein
VPSVCGGALTSATVLLLEQAASVAMSIAVLN